MIIYLDTDYRCHVENDGTMKEIDLAIEDKCVEYIEGYRFVPPGETWTREDGEVFFGGMWSPWKDSTSLELAQAAADRVQLAADIQNDILLDTIYNLITEQ